MSAPDLDSLEFFDGADDPPHPEDSNFFDDPFAPRRAFHSPNSIFPSYSFCPPPRDSPTRPRPFIHHILRSNSQITSVRHFSFTDSHSLVFGCLNAVHYVTQWSKAESSILFPAKELTIVELLDVHPSEVFIACNGPSRNVRGGSLATGSSVWDCNVHRGHVSALFFAPSFNRIVSASLDGTLVCSDLVKQRRCFVYRKNQGAKGITTGGIRHDETVIGVGREDGIVGLFDHRDGEVSEMKAHAGWVNAIGFCVSEPIFATAGIDRSVRIWDLRKLSEPIFVERAIPFGVKKVLFAADQSCFAIGTEGCVLRLSVGPEPAPLPMLVSTVGIVSADMCIDSNRIVYSTEDMVLSALSFDLDGGESLAVSGEAPHA
jgi:WD40 repeat protein